MKYLSLSYSLLGHGSCFQFLAVKIPRQGLCWSWWEGREGTHRLPFAWQVLQEGAESPEQNLGLEALMSSGRVDNLAVVMGLHPDYLIRFWRLHYLLLHTDGPLASSWRHYIAIMVSQTEPHCQGGGRTGGFSLHIFCWGLPEPIPFIMRSSRGEPCLYLTIEL